MSYFFVVTLGSVPSHQVDEVSRQVFAFGASGVQEDLAFEQLGEFYEVKEIGRSHTKLVVYFDEDPSKELLEIWEKSYPGISITVEKQEHKDWMETWKQGFEAFELVDGVFVVPSWKEIPRQAKAALRIDPGMAFGTGTHATTQLASELLVSLAAKSKGKNLLDVGTGTGVLALLAEQLGFSDIVGIEIDLEARRTAKENIELNASRVCILDKDVSQVEGPFNVVVANIIDGVLVRLQDDLKRLVESEGYLLLTGVLEERGPGFWERFDSSGFELLASSQKEEWLGFLLRKKA